MLIWKYSTAIALGVVFFLSGVAYSAIKWRRVDGKVGPDPLTSVAASDSFHVWAVGIPSHVIHSTNGGRMWLSLPNTNLDRTSFTDSLNGWGFFDINPDGVIRHTTDGGQTWVVQNDTTEMKLFAIKFIDSLHGVSVGAGVGALFTSDGGLTWRKKLYPLSTTSIHCLEILDTNHIWIGGNNFYGTVDTSVVFFSPDWGNTWFAQTLHDRWQHTTVISIRFFDTLNGLLFSVYGNGSEHYLYRTNDGGLTWNKFFELSAFSNWILEDMDAVDSLHIWMCGDLFTQGDSYAALLSTQNGGLSWDTILTSTASIFLDIEMLTNGLGWACGGEGLLYIYSDLMLGDLNLDGQITPEDAVLELNKVFIGEAIPALPEAADVNCSQTLTSADAVLMMNRVFLGTGFPCSN